jgi:hypothetical protein
VRCRVTHPTGANGFLIQIQLLNRLGDMGSHRPAHLCARRVSCQLARHECSSFMQPVGINLGWRASLPTLHVVRKEIVEGV